MPEILCVNENTIEEACLEWYESLGYDRLYGPDIGPGGQAEERESYQDVILISRFQEALSRLNPKTDYQTLDEAAKKVLHTSQPSLTLNNKAFHEMLRDGVEVEVLKDGIVRGERIRLIDFENPANNEWLAIDQYTVEENGHTRRPDVVIFVNGLPLAVIELKNPASENTDIWAAYRQLQTYKMQVPSLFVTNELLVISDGFGARVGSLTAGKERFAPWRTIDGEILASEAETMELETLVRGLFRKEFLLDYLKSFITFEEDNGETVKKIAGYHQFHATRKAVGKTIEATAVTGDRRIGVIWHTQGSGKSLTMVFYSRKLAQEPALENPTIVVVTDRNDLDGQLYRTFWQNQSLLGQVPVNAESRSQLKKLLHQNASGGIIFTTIQKFFPEQKGEAHPLLSDRRNIVVIADEAHRSQYDFIDGFARHLRDALPNASYLGFTGTPIELEDRNTPAVFGNYVDVYDIEQAVRDGATVPIFYESRLVKVQHLDETLQKTLDEEFDEITETQEEMVRSQLKRKWAALEAVVGSKPRMEAVAKDLVRHFEDRLSAMDGKGMIVCMSRRICVELYKELVKIRPDWHSSDDTKGALKVVMTGSASDSTDWQEHIRDKQRREALAERFKKPDDPFKLVIVRDMWLTGFDAPCMHTMYLDKPMKGHGLMQAITRGNRVFRDKPGGLVVDYLGLADGLKKAMATYTVSGGKGKAAHDQDEALSLLREKIGVCRDLFHGFDLQDLMTSSPKDQLKKYPNAIDHILSLNNGKKRFVDTVLAISKAFALAVPLEGALELRDEVKLYQTLKAGLVKRDAYGKHGSEEKESTETAIRQIVSEAIVTEQVIDLFDLAGLNKPDISILSEDFLEEIHRIPQKNLAVELLRKLLNDEVKTKSRTMLVQSRSFSAKLAETIRKYENRSIETVQVIEELIELAKEMKEADQRGEKLGLKEDELAFYDALETSDSAVQVMGDQVLKAIAKELTEKVRKNVTIDWSLKEQVRAKLRTMVKRVLRRHKYPPDKTEKAADVVLEQAELLCEGWVSK